MTFEPAFSEPLHVGRPNIGDRERFLEMVGEALDRRWLSNDGPLLREFEQKLAEYLGVKHVIAIANGTIALEIGIKALGLTGEVIVPSFTFVATAHSLEWLGVTPVFADIDPETHTLDPAAVRAAITPQTTGIIGVHLWGRPAPVAELEAIAEEHGLALMFDAAHAFGVSDGTRMVGGAGKLEILSFHATKFFNAIEGGAIVTDDDEVAKKAKLMRNFGFVGNDDVREEGTNGKLNEIAAAMGISNLAVIDDVIAVNRRNYEAYVRETADIPGISILPIATETPSNYQYVVMLVDESCAASRDDVLAVLQQNNVLARRYFWPGVHRMQPYRDRDPHAGDRLPNTVKVANSVIVLPTGTAVDEADIAKIAGIVRDRVASA